MVKLIAVHFYKFGHPRMARYVHPMKQSSPWQENKRLYQTKSNCAWLYYLELIQLFQQQHRWQRMEANCRVGSAPRSSLVPLATATYCGTPQHHLAPWRIAASHWEDCRSCLYPISILLVQSVIGMPQAFRTILRFCRGHVYTSNESNAKIQHNLNKKHK